MRPDYRLCDVCGELTRLDFIAACTDRQMDGAGSMENVVESIDLCGTCAVLALKQVFLGKDSSYEDAQRFVKWAKKAPAKCQKREK